MKKIIAIALLATLFAEVLLAAAIFNCNRCNGSGRVQISLKVKCHSCHGIKKRCSTCNGRGRRYIPAGPGPYGMPAMNEVCFTCFGNGYVDCTTCWGTGTEVLTGTDTCPQCKGYGKFVL